MGVFYVLCHNRPMWGPGHYKNHRTQGEESMHYSRMKVRGTNIQTLRSAMLRCFSVADCCYHDGSRNAYRQIDYVAIISVEVQKVPVARSRHRKNELVLKQTDPGNCNCLGQELDSKGVQPHLADAALLRALSIAGIEFRSMMMIGRQSLGRSTRYEHEMKESNITW